MVDASTQAPRERNLASSEWQQRKGEQGSKRFVVGTTQLIGVGVTLTRAAMIFLMGPDYTLRVKLQAIGRVNRAKVVQPAPVTLSLRFTLRGFEYEDTIRKRQDFRYEAQQQTYGSGGSVE